MSYLIKRNFLLFLLFGTLSCQSTEELPESAFDGQYDAFGIQVLSGTTNGSDFREDRDTFLFELTIGSSSFTSSVFASCSGTFNLEEDQLVFDSEDCACWCACDLAVDCAGDPILGAFEYTWKEDTLFLRSVVETIDTIDFPTVEETIVASRLEKRFELIKR